MTIEINARGALIELAVRKTWAINLRSGRRKIKTLEQAKACAAAVTGGDRIALARQFKEAPRDAWLVQLAHGENEVARAVRGLKLLLEDSVPNRIDQ